MFDSRRRGGPGDGPAIQRSPAGTPGKRTLVESQLGSTPTSASPPAGALPPEVRAKMESYFGADFSTVRVREDARARELGAVAYARGEELVFQPGKYDPSSRAGQQLIGHELAHVVQQRQGRVPMPDGGAGAPVQRYRELNEGLTHLSDQGTMFVNTRPEPNKVFYAKLAALQQAQSALATAGSFIHLQAAEIHGSYAKIEPRFVGPGSDQGRIYNSTQDGHEGGERRRLGTQGSNMGMASDCNNAARMVMGIVHDPTVTDGAPDQQTIERPVMGTGDREREITPPLEVSNATTSVERAALTALTDSLIRYRTAVAEREVAVTHPGSVTAFLHDTEALTPGARAWRILGTIRASHPQLYTDFTAWAGIDAMAAPEVGDALVAWRLGCDSTAVNARGNAALADAMTAIIGNDVKRGAMATALAQRIVAQRQALLGLVPPENHVVKRGKLTTELEKLETVQARIAGFDGTNAAAIATAVLAFLGIEPNTPWQRVGITMQDGYGTDQDGEGIHVSDSLGMGLEVDLAVAYTSNQLWNKHWGGVVMTEPSGDYVTLENDASTEEHGQVNTQWRFTMYGSKKPGQSFHAKNEATGDFGPRASTMRFRNPNRTARPLPALTPAERLEQLRREEAERQAAEQRRRALVEDLRKKGIPSGLTIRPYSCGTEALRSERPPDMDDGGPPPLCKADGTPQVQTDPGLEAEAEAHGIASADHVPPEARDGSGHAEEAKAVDAPGAPEGPAPEEAEEAQEAEEA